MTDPALNGGGLEILVTLQVARGLQNGTSMKALINDENHKNG